MPAASVEGATRTWGAPVASVVEDEAEWEAPETSLEEAAYRVLGGAHWYRSK